MIGNIIKIALLILFFLIIPWNENYLLNKIFADENQTIYEEKVVWSLSTAPVTINGEDYIFKSGLEIEAGVTIVLKNHARIVVEGGELEISGEMNHPVTFQGVANSDENFVFLVDGASRVYINNAVFNKGGYNQCLAVNEKNFLKKAFAYYIGDCLTEAALNIQSSQNISINNSTFNENYKAINIIDSDAVLLTNNSFLHSDKMAVYSENSGEIIAKSNCWMRPSGPTYEGNPGGRGEEIRGDFSLDPRECGSEFKPIIFIPGIGGSWNWTEMLAESSLDDWDFTPFVHSYDAWEDSLKDLGYQKNRDYFIAFYDWRDDNREGVENYLLPTLERAREISYDENFDIIAHSMGGFMTLEYLMGDDYENDIDKVVLEGTPLMGASKVYPTWEGGLLPEGWEVLEYYLNVLSWKDENRGLSYYDIIHKYIPSAKQLMPIYNYIEKDGNLINFWEMEEQNDYLIELMPKIGENQNDFDFENLLMIQGTGYDTSEIIKVDEYNGEDSDKLWKDGKPNPYPLEKENKAGDGTVLNMSSGWIPFFETVTLEDVSHNDLPVKAVHEAGDFLGIDFEDKEYPETIKDKLLFIFACPIDVEIKDSSGNIVDKDESQIDGAYYYSDGNDDGYKIIEIQNPNDEEYSIEITGNGDGEYDGIVYKYFDGGSASSEFNGNIQDEEEVNYNVSVDNESVFVEKIEVTVEEEEVEISENNLSSVVTTNAEESNSESEDDDEDDDDYNDDEDDEEDDEEDDDNKIQVKKIFSSIINNSRNNKEEKNNIFTALAKTDSQNEGTVEEKPNLQVAGSQVEQNFSLKKILILIFSMILISFFGVRTILKNKFSF